MSTSLSMLAQKVRSRLFELFDATELSETQIVIGPPHEAARQQEDEQYSRDYLCLFLYHVGYSGFPADATSADPLYVKALCMITAMGGRSGNKTPGDSELKLIGAVAECFHNNPVLELESAQLQIVPMQLTLDDINHLWSTQKNTPYRLSLAYEFALLPIPLKTRVEDAPRVKTVSIAVHPTEGSSVKT